MNFETYLLEQLKIHPSMEPRDFLKLCYQAAFGAEHLLADAEKAKAYLQEEYEKTAAADLPVYEQISENICRVNLAAWKFHGLPLEWLFRMFVASFGKRDGGEERFRSYLEKTEKVLAEVGYPMEDWKSDLADYLAEGIRPVHHSPAYREAEHPAYRIAEVQFLRLLPILKKAAEREDEKPFVIAIDGRAASGKTTMTQQLKTILQAEVVQMDDFFLPLELRTAERFAQPGGNVHYERFAAEVLPYLSEKTPFSYRIFDCSKMDFGGERLVEAAKYRIVEGSYSCHPVFGRYADLTVFSDIDPEIQLERIRKRNGDAMAEMFQKRWIPLEEAYFAACAIREKADLCLSAKTEK